MDRENDLCRQKISQAVDILREENVDLWLTLLRETSEMKDPVYPFTVDSSVVWESAFLIHSSGQTVAVVGSLDANAVRSRGLYDKVIGYEQDISPELLTVVTELAPRSIAINYSKHNNTADGLTHGLFLSLTEDYLRGTDFLKHLVPAEGIIGKIRGRKTEAELARIEKAIYETQDIMGEICSNLRPGCNERQIHMAVRKELIRRGHQDAWSSEGNPAVDIGYGSHHGHGGPGDRSASPGDILHLDFGARVDEYSADLQRIWYFRDNGDSVPEEIQDAFNTVKGAITAAAKMLRPGVEGWTVDKVARDYLISRGYPEFNHALGHQLGRMAHDGGSLLGPLWPKYGNRPHGVVEKGNVFTLELGIYTSRGYVSLEDDVVVTDSGCKFLSVPQDKIWLIG